MKTELKDCILYVIKKLQEEYGVPKLKGFPSKHTYSRFERKHDISISEKRWQQWANEIGVDYNQLKDILEIMENKGILEKFKFIPDYMLRS